MTTTFYAYVYRDPSRSQECFYVGKGKNKRAWHHLKRTDMHPLVQRLQKMKREGIEPVIEFLCKDVDEELAFLVEMEAISKWGRKDLGKGTLLNLSDGGEGPTGAKHSEAAKKQRADSNRGKKRTAEQRATMRSPGYSEVGLQALREKAKTRVGNVKWSQQQRDAWSAKRQGTKQPPKKGDARWASPEAREAARQRAIASWAKRKGNM